MALILNIETSSTNCSVALSQEGTILALKEDYNTSYSHAEVLHLYIDEVFKIAQIAPQQIDAVAVSKGPGSYTGLRIGVSSAKGLCYALDKPLIAVSTLEALAHQVSIDKGLIIPLLDARRMEVYSAIFNSDYSAHTPIKAEVLEETSYQKLLAANLIYFLGSGVDKLKTIIQHPNANYIEGKLPSASTLGSIATKKFKTSHFEDVAYFEPFYLKDFVAIKPRLS